jgi:hypothetical protein
MPKERSGERQLKKSGWPRNFAMAFTRQKVTGLPGGERQAQRGVSAPSPAARRVQSEAQLQEVAHVCLLRTSGRSPLLVGALQSIDPYRPERGREAPERN